MPTKRLYVPSDPLDNLKRCRECKQRKPIRDFATKRMMTCEACRQTRKSTADKPRHVPPLDPARPAARPVGTWREIHNLRCRERYRAVVYAKLQKDPYAMRTPRNPSSVRVCVHCRNAVPLHLMASPRARICNRCEDLERRRMYPWLYDK